MLSFPELRDAEPAVFSRAAGKWQRFAQLIGERGDELAKQIKSLEKWTGKGSEAAKGDLNEQRKRLADAAEQMGRIPPVLTQVGTILTADQARLREAIATANDNSLVIQPDGTVVATDRTVGNTPYPVPGRSPQQTLPDQKQVAAQLTPVVQGILRHATAADEEAAAALRKLTAQAAGMAPGAKDATVIAGNTSIPGPKAKPGEVNDWWKSLTPQQQESLLFMHSEKIGNLDGIPAEVRDRANRAVLAQEKAKLIEMRDQDPGKAAEINGKLKGIGEIEDRLNTKPSAEHQQPYLLKISSDGTGRAIVAMGNPDTAKNVATYVPGTYSTVADMKTDLTRADQMVLAAKNAGSPSTSVITWVGYEAPQGIPEAAQNKFADNGKAALNNFQDGLRETHQGEKSHNTVVGHSYGTVLIGHAARDGKLNADEAVFVASPGVGVTNVKDLHLTGVPEDKVADRVHSTTAQYDPINVVAGTHGPSPTQFTNTFESAPGPPSAVGWNQAVHSMYWETGNPALTNMGNIIAGKPTF
ncbi:hypothetical protein JOF56_011152 [Kibdelosporangium banguiense]|uniref:DUF1023 domain-containing protein n=1 Tax=Kibdelosporangium banguiense TaxID=1365924 RepID=A0ABS4U279_9PSEU|nr:alpha/beta hydrolase [Kibdelosporangium banguiense]MBP2330767.1 hypothetical protein [Kibdelosporangium banguiense]